MRYWKQPKFLTYPKVSIIVATFNQGPELSCLLSSLLSQKYPNWKAKVLHDGPFTDPIKEVIDQGWDLSRFEFLETEKRENCFGHNLREIGRSISIQDGCDAVLFTNGDNYYVPTFLPDTAARIADNDLVYTSCVHSHKMWKPLPTKLQRGKIDVGCCLFNAKSIQSVAWSRRDFAADWFFIESLMHSCKPFRAAHIDRFLFVHN